MNNEKQKMSIWKKNKIILTIIIIFSCLLFLQSCLKIDNDFWFTIKEGEYVLNNGFPTTVPFTIYDNLDFVYQSWGTGVIFYIVYNTLGAYGILSLTAVIFILITYFFYKLCLLVSNNKYIISGIITMIGMCMLSVSGFITTRPQIFTYLNLILVLYFMELYVKNNNRKYLIPLLLISLVQINIHGMFFLMLIIFMLPFVAEYVINKIRKKENKYNLKPIIITIILMLLIGLINPYGIKTILYVFNSYGQSIMEDNIMELKALSLPNGIVHISFILLIYILYFKKRNISIRYYLFLFGTTYLAFDTYRGISLFLIASLYPLSYIYKNKFNKYKDSFYKFCNYIINDKKLTIFIKSMTIICIILTMIFTTKSFYPSSKNAIDYIVSNYNTNDIILYTFFDDGSYAVYKDLKVNIDPRAEVYLKNNNHKSDILEEYLNLNTGKTYYKDYLDKYNFTHLLINKEDIMYIYLKRDSYNYTKVKKIGDYYIYIRNDLL